MEGGKHEKKYVEFVFSLVNTSCVYIIICKSSPLYSLPPPPPPPPPRLIEVAKWRSLVRRRKKTLGLVFILN